MEENKNVAIKAEKDHTSAVESAYDYLENFDILETITNVGNDEVFTPRKTCDMILDSLPEEVWHNPNYKWLNPATKNGIFEREIAIRLDRGLKDIIPDEETRKKHILQNMIFAIGQTKFTANVARRALYYCSQANRKCDGIKAPDGHYINGYAIGNGTWFDDEEGNIKTPRTEHTFDKDGKCIYCRVKSDSKYNSSEQREHYAYEFIHYGKLALERHLQDLFFKGDRSMKFDVIIGNPPYMLNDGGGTGDSAIPIYNLFVQNAIGLNPKYASFIVPARWYSGGKGLDSFREAMLNDKCISELHDFPETSDCFPNNNIRGGVCYFIWNRDNRDAPTIYNHFKGNVESLTRPLLENNNQFFVRYNKAISILRKVKAFNEKTFDTIVSSRLPFGIPSNFSGYVEEKDDIHYIALYRSDRSKTTPKKVYISKKDISKNIELVNKIKVLVSKASPGGDEYPHSVISAPIIAESPSACTETYLIVDVVENLESAQSVISYMKTKFFRFMMALLKNTQNISKDVFSLVPIQNNKSIIYTDSYLYRKYNIDEEEQKFIDTLIREMN